MAAESRVVWHIFSNFRQVSHLRWAQPLLPAQWPCRCPNHPDKIESTWEHIKKLPFWCRDMQRPLRLCPFSWPKQQPHWHHNHYTKEFQKHHPMITGGHGGPGLFFTSSECCLSHHRAIDADWMLKKQWQEKKGENMERQAQRPWKTIEKRYSIRCNQTKRSKMFQSRSANAKCLSFGVTEFKHCISAAWSRQPCIWSTAAFRMCCVVRRVWIAVAGLVGLRLGAPCAPSEKNDGAMFSPLKFWDPVLLNISKISSNFWVPKIILPRYVRSRWNSQVYIMLGYLSDITTQNLREKHDDWNLSLVLSFLSSLPTSSSYCEARSYHSWLDKSGFSRDSLTQIEPHCGAKQQSKTTSKEQHNTSAQRKHARTIEVVCIFISRISRALKSSVKPPNTLDCSDTFSMALSHRSLRSDVAMPCTQTKDSKCISCIVCLAAEALN